ncbi:MAG: four helix bundle protein [Bacteroidota bacterium]
MEKLRESEIRSESLELVVETYRIMQILPESVEHKFKIDFLNISFLISSQIADAFSALQNDQAEDNVKNALKGINDLSDHLKTLDEEKFTAQKELNEIRHLVSRIQEDLEVFLATLQIIKLDRFSPKLEKTCI